MEDELADFVRSRYPALLRRAFLLTGDHGYAEDLVQDSLAKLWLASARREVTNPDAYLRRVMVHGSISRWRGRRPWDVVAAMEGKEHHVPEPTAEVDEHDYLWRGIMTLPTRQRAILVLRYYEDLTEAEICDALSISAGTVRSQTSKARQKLRLLIAQTEEVSS